ncbi:hypothetical protein CEXT_545871 [Caerostris extrusa]|uniref:Sesquiterpene synthase n=1 Tax=Caerostris extrusa TaxID=172846 RepID=A0AAV4QGE6_CAEEX|nr:hypothetical protein CEXT_545871 [Caerostris extrusa]
MEESQTSMPLNEANGEIIENDINMKESSSLSPKTVSLRLFRTCLLDQPRHRATSTMNTLKYMRLRQEGSLNEQTFKRAVVEKCDWAYEDFETAEMVQDSTMRTLQERFRKEEDENTCLQKSVDTLMTVGRICRRTSEMHKQHYAHLYKKSEEITCTIIAKVVDKVVEKYLQSMSLSDTLQFWRDLDDWYHPFREIGDPIPKRYTISQILKYFNFVFKYLNMFQ